MQASMICQTPKVPHFQTLGRASANPCFTQQSKRTVKATELRQFQHESFFVRTKSTTLQITIKSRIRKKSKTQASHHNQDPEDQQKSKGKSSKPYKRAFYNWLKMFLAVIKQQRSIQRTFNYYLLIQNRQCRSSKVVKILLKQTRHLVNLTAQ